MVKLNMDKLNLPSKPTGQPELSANEFQEKLYNWLQDQGLISELRGHLRTQMVTAFQDNVAGTSTNQQISVSPKVQALSTLVADFLLQQGFSYTLSVFVTEVPLVGQVFSQFSQSAVRKTLESGYKFSPHEVEDIIETLGFVPGSQVFNQALLLYHGNNGMSSNHVSEPLLLCIMRALSKQFKRKDSELINGNKDVRGQNLFPPNEADNAKPRKSDKNLNAIGIKGNWLEEVDISLMQNNPKLCPITCLQEYMKRVHEEELCKVREEEAAKYKSLMEQKLKDFEKKDLTDKHKGLKEWKENIEAEFNERGRNLSKLAKQLRAQHMELSEKVAYLEIESQEMKEREQQFKSEQERGCKELELKKSEIEAQKAKLNEAFIKLAADQEAINKLQKNLLEKEMVTPKKEESLVLDKEFITKIQEQYDSLRLMLSKKKPPETYVVAPAFCTNDDSLAFVNREDKGLQTSDLSDNCNEKGNEIILRIEDEKRELNEQVFQQRQRIDELTMRAAELSNQLQDAQVAMQLLVPNQFAMTTPPLTAPLMPRLQPRPQWPPHIGSGEETSFVAMHPPGNPSNSTRFPASAARQTGAVRRRPRRTVLQQSRPQDPINISFSSDDSTATTDEMIEEARIRLRRLEQESFNIHQNYEEFRSRHNNLESTASIIFHPEQLSTLNPFDLRHTNFSSSFSGQPSRNNRGQNSQFRSFGSRFSHFAVSRPIITSIFPNTDHLSGNNNYRPKDVLSTGTDTVIAKELEESLEDTGFVISNEGTELCFTDNDQNAVCKPYVAPIRTKSPTDVVNHVNDYRQPLKNKVVQNTLKSHSFSCNKVDKGIRSNRSRNNDNFVYNEEKISPKIKINESVGKDGRSSSGNSREKPDSCSDNFKKDDTSRLKFSDVVTVVNDSTETNNTCINNELTVLNTMVDQFDQNKMKFSVAQEPLKIKSNNTYRKNHKKVVEIIDIDVDSDASDIDQSISRQDNGKKMTKRSNYDSSYVSGIADKEKVCDSDEKSKECKKHTHDEVDSLAKAEEQSPAIHFETSDFSDDDSKNNLPVKVLLKQRSIKTSSSSTPFSDNKQFEVSFEEVQDRDTSNSSESEINVNQGPIKSQSLPAAMTKSFFSSEEDGYSLKNFESGDISSIRGKVYEGISFDTNKMSEDKWYDVSSDNVSNFFKGENNKRIDVTQEKRIILKMSSGNNTIDSSVRQNGNSFPQFDPVCFRDQLNCNYSYPACYQNLVNRILSKSFKSSWRVKLKLSGYNQLPRYRNFGFDNPLLLSSPLNSNRKSFFDITDDDEINLEKSRL